MSQTYFVIANSDGDTYVSCYSLGALLDLIDAEADAVVDGCRLVDLAMASIPDNPETNCWGDGMLIIKGEIIKPRPVVQVTKWEVD